MTFEQRFQEFREAVAALPYAQDEDFIIKAKQLDDAGRRLMFEGFPTAEDFHAALKLMDHLVTRLAEYRTEDVGAQLTAERPTTAGAVSRNMEKRLQSIRKAGINLGYTDEFGNPREL